MHGAADSLEKLGIKDIPSIHISERDFAGESTYIGGTRRFITTNPDVVMEVTRDGSARLIVNDELVASQSATAAKLIEIERSDGQITSVNLWHEGKAQKIEGYFEPIYEADGTLISLRKYGSDGNSQSIIRLDGSIEEIGHLSDGNSLVKEVKTTLDDERLALDHLVRKLYVQADQFIGRDLDHIRDTILDGLSDIQFLASPFFQPGRIDPRVTPEVHAYHLHQMRMILSGSRRNVEVSTLIQDAMSYYRSTLGNRNRSTDPRIQKALLLSTIL